MSSKDSNVDVLIVGAGAAGMMAAASAAAYGLNTRIIDKRTHQIRAGHGDGLHARMMEILDTFGLAKQITEQGFEFKRTVAWNAGDDGNLTQLADTSHAWEPQSAFSTTSLTQAKIVDILLGYVNANSSIEVERGVMTESITFEKGAEYPVKLNVREVLTDEALPSNNDIRIDNDEAILNDAKQSKLSERTIHAKYVVACDGAHSFIRRTLDIPMVGDDMEIIWGVMDIWAITDVPSARVVNVVQGRGRGLMWIPRERGMIRVYTVVGLAKDEEEAKLIKANTTPDTIIAAARELLHPYKISYKHCEWWATYQIGQRCATENIHESGHIFLAGDAVHTHSPQAGQGLNVSMADTYNLMWKLNLVLKGLAKPELLETYRDERMILAKQLVAHDRSQAAIMSGREPPPPPPDTEVVHVTLDKIRNGAFMTTTHGLYVTYQPSIITTSASNNSQPSTLMIGEGNLPEGILTGMRMPSFQVRRHADTAIRYLAEAFQSDGRFRFVLFAGDVSQAAKLDRLKAVAQNIERLMQTYRLANCPLNAVIDTITVHTSNPQTVSILDLPDVCRPLDPEYGYEYYKVFFDEEDIVDRFGVHLGSAYKKYLVDPSLGRLVLLRPDGYVAYQGLLEDFGPVDRYFEGLLLKQG